MKKIILFILLFIVTGCANFSTYVNRSEILDYVGNELGLEYLSLSENYGEMNGDRIWTVVDYDNNITFHVVDHVHPENGDTSHILDDDYYDSVFYKYYGDILTADDILKVTKDDSMGIKKVELVCSYKNRTDLMTCYEALKSYKEQYTMIGYNLNVGYKLVYDNSFLADNIYMNGTSAGIVSEIDESKYSEALYNYFSCGLFHNLHSILSEMNSSEINETISLVDNYNIVLSNDIIANNIISVGGNISFGGLFTLLNLENFNTTGDLTHFVVYDKNSNKYEFSYDFYDKTNDEYYYKLNNDKVSMKSTSYFKLFDVNEMFDINMKLGK